MKSLTGVAAAAMLAAFAAGNAAGRTYLVSGELCYADGARLYASDGSLSFQPASPTGIYLFETNAALPSYTAHPPSGRAVERWALVSLTDAAMHGSYEAASPLLEAFPGDGRVSDDGLVYSPKWKQFSADAGSFIHAAPCFKWLEYGIAFDPNTQSGGSGVDAALAMEGVAYTNTVVLHGRPSTSRWSPQYHTLLGLSTNAAATTADFEFGGRVENAGELFGATNGATVVLYGVWRADPISVALDRGDGAVAGDTNIYAVCGQSMPPAVMPSRPGGQFKGYWHEEAVGGPVQYYGPQGESVRDWDMEYAATLKARWSPVAASVSFEDGDGAEGGSGSIEVLYGALPPDIKVPVRKGWIFDGYWSFSVGGTRYYDESGKPTTEAWTRVAPFKLYAHWKPVEYTIVYIWDGGTPGGYVQNSAVSGMPFPVSIPVRDGYVFAGFELSGEYDPAAAGYGDTPNKAVAQSVKDGFCPAQPGQRFMYFVNLASEATTVTLRARWEKTGDAASVATAMPKSMLRRAAASAGDGESGDAGVPPSAEELEQAADCAETLQLVPWMIEDKTQKQTNGCWMVGSDPGATNGTAVFCSITNVAEINVAEIEEEDGKPFGRGIARLGATVTGKGELKFRWKATVAMPDVPKSDPSILGAFVVVTQSFSNSNVYSKFIPEEQRPGTNNWQEVAISIDTDEELDVVWFANTYSERYDLWIDDIRLDGIRCVPRSIVAEAESVDLPYDGEGHSASVKVAYLPTNEYEVTYALAENGQYSGDDLVFMNATNTTVWYVVSAKGFPSYTNSVPVKITQATNSWTVEPSFTGNWLQDGTNCLNGVAKFGTVTVEYFDSVGMTVSPDAITGTGSYMARFTVAETENWTGLTKEVSFNVYGVGASATGYAGAYDGSGHGIAVSVSNPESGWTIGYALSPDAEYKAECPLFTNVCETSVWYRVSAEGYEPLIGSALVKITQAENSWTVEPSFSGNWQQDGTNCLKGAAKFGMATIEYFNSVDMPVSSDVIAGAGSYTARFTVAETENWTGLTKEVSFNVYGVGASATGYAGAYDGSGHGIAVSVSNPESGWTIGYALSPDAEYKAECPLFTNVCETSVWYRVSAAGYVSLTGCASVKIACATNTWKVAPSMASWRDTEDASEPESASAFGEVIVAYKTANGRVLPSRPSVRGDYVAVFTVEGSENWTSVSTEVPFTIYESEPVVCVMATSCMGEYDGSSHSIEVSVDPGATNRCSARYSLTKDGPFADAAPVYVQAMTNGPVKVWYEVLADGYAGVTNFATVEIFKATNAWLVVPNMAGRTAGVEYEPPAAVPQFGNVSVVYDGAATNAPRNAGIHTARFTVPETRNWCGLVTNISYRIAGDGSSGEEDDGGDSGGDSGGDGGGEGEGGGSGGGGEESDAYAIAFTNDATYAKAQTIAGALYNADGSLAGVVQLKFGKKNARKSTVRVSGSATLLDGRKASARGVTLKFGEDGAVSGTLTFKELVGEMALVAGADGVGLLAGASYFMKAAKVGGPLAGGAASGVFRLSDDFDLAVAGTLQTDLLPFEEPFSVVRRKWKFPGNASVKLQTDKATGLKSLTVSYGRNGDKTNKSSIKLSYTEKTGRFTGSFKAYSVSENARGSKKLVKYTVKIVGFVLDGSGVGAATVKKPAGGPWAVSVE